MQRFGPRHRHRLLISLLASFVGPFHQGIQRAPIKAHHFPSTDFMSYNYYIFREPRTPSPAGTVIPTAATWMTGNQPVQLIRTNIGHSPRATISQSPRTKIEGKLIVPAQEKILTDAGC